MRGGRFRHGKSAFQIHGRKEKEMAKLIRLSDVEPESYEPPLKSRRGIDAKRSKVACDTGYDNGRKPRVTVSRTLLPPGGENQPHYHVKCDAGMHILSGRLRMFFGPPHQVEQADVEAGDFVFVPQGEIHRLVNLSKTEPAEWVSCYGGVSCWEEAETIFVEPPKK